MPELSTILLFGTAALVLLIVPGPAVFYITAQSVDQGTKAGIVSTLGIALGSLVHVMAAALGVSTILVTSALAFDIVKYVGAAYLIYLGVQKLMSKTMSINNLKFDAVNYKKIFFRGVVVNVLNPKTALFFFAFLPQFVNASAGSVTTQMLFFGLLFIAMGIISDGLYALAAGKASNFLKKNLFVLKYQNYFSGSVYIFLGLAAAISGSNNK